MYWIFILPLFITKEPFAVDIVILYRDPSVIICEKPVGVSSESPGMPELVASLIGQTVWPVHRLDQGTGGVIVLALSRDSCSSMQALFQHSAVQKEYLAVVSGCPGTQSGSWTDLLWHDRAKNKSFVVNRSRSGVKEGSCDWTVLETVTHDHHTFSLVRIRLHTGRTHQIRIQFGSRGFPLVGDRKYGSRIPSDTVALWSAAVRFCSPQHQNGVVSAVSTPPPVFPWNMFSAVHL